ncbi:MAG: single-stranded-DNA-specific exonuclease RecJ [Armatimonadetes bacterium]|nr:single-stranded-DNA-specific exonuclease RecJ [Armatimonadota bacterium]
MPRQPITNWRTIPRRPREEALLAARLRIHPLAAAALVASGVNSPEQAAAYITGNLEALPSPFEMAGMAEAVDVIIAAVRDRHPILLHGDYDADGICSTAILCRALQDIGATAFYYLPDRFEDGYGVSPAALREAAGRGVRLVITADCGITAHDELSLARELGLRVVVLDHHLPLDTLPPADAIVAPRLPNWEYRCPDMPASALSLRLVQALGEALGGDGMAAAERFADIAAVGTVADVAPMEGENRVIVRAGLDAIRRTRWVGLKALKDIAGIGDVVRAWDVGFRIAPRINAAGRLADAALALDLLTTDDETEAYRLAHHLDNHNRERQRIQEQILAQALEMVALSPELLEYPVLVLSSPQWHVGVVGIVAAKLVEQFGRPTILLVEEGEGTRAEARGSARSTEGFDIAFALSACEDLLTTFGGHAMAAGLRLPRENIPSLREGLRRVAEEFGFAEPAGAAPPAVIEAGLEELDETLPRDLARLEPFGRGNPEPLFSARSLEVVEARTVGRSMEHLKLILTDGRRTVEAIGYGMARARNETGPNALVDVCFVPVLDEYWGPPSVQLRLVGIRKARR